LLTLKLVMSMWSLLGAIAVSITSITQVKPEAIGLSLITSVAHPTILAAETTTPDPTAQNAVRAFLVSLQKFGYNTAAQGVWIQTNNGVMLAENNGTQPIAAASLTKIATTLAALDTWGTGHQFITKIGTNGKIIGNVLQGDLIIEGSGDPLFVWEEAIALGNALNRLGISQVNGNLVITGAFYMNFETNPQRTSGFLRQAINASAWTNEILSLYQPIKSRVQPPRVIISGKSIVARQLPVNARSPVATPLIAHSSLPLWQILKRMNTYSNNDMAEMLATSLGGGRAIAQIVIKASGLPSTEIRLINGSGLGQQNQISPRAIVGMLMTIHNLAQISSLSLADLFPISDCRCGTIANRNLPSGTIVKTGTLSDVSSLAGIIQTRDRGTIWFALLNRGAGDLDIFHQLQDRVVLALTKQWGIKDKSSFGQPNFTPVVWEDRDRDELLVK